MTEIQLPAIDYRVILQPAIIFGWAIVLLVLDLFIANKRTVGLLALAGLIAAAVAGATMWNVEAVTFNEMIQINRYALVFNWIFLGVTAITILISHEYLERQGILRGEYYVLLLMATGAMMLLAQGMDLIVLFLGLELLSITLYILTGFAYPRNASEEAAMKYLIIGAFAAGFLVFGIALVFGATGFSNLVQIGSALPQLAGTSMQQMALVGAALITVGFGYKVAMAPFHMWTPDVYEGAPTPVAAFMSVGTKAAGFAALTQVLLVGFGPLQTLWGAALAALAAVTMLIGNLSALAQRNVKRMLAYSSIGHAGYILMGLLSGTQRGIQGVLFYLVAYAFTNLAAFAVLIALEKRGEAAWDMDDLAGLFRRQPWLAVAMALCMLSLAGVPPTAGFWGKLYVFTAAWEQGYYWLTLIAVLTSAVSVFFYLRIIAQMFMRDSTRTHQSTGGALFRLGLIIATVGILVVGLVPGPIADAVQQAIGGR